MWLFGGYPPFRGVFDLGFPRETTPLVLEGPPPKQKMRRPLFAVVAKGNQEENHSILEGPPPKKKTQAICFAFLAEWLAPLQTGVPLTLRTVVPPKKAQQESGFPFGGPFQPTKNKRDHMLLSTDQKTTTETTCSFQKKRNVPFQPTKINHQRDTPLFFVSPRAHARPSAYRLQARSLAHRRPGAAPWRSSPPGPRSAAPPR